MRRLDRIVLGLCTLLLVTAPARADVSPDTLAQDWSRVPEYRLVPGDELVLDFGRDPDVVGSPPPRTQLIRPDGRISVFPIGDVVAAGHTVRELQAVVVQLLSAELRNPRVSVEVQKIAGNKVHLIGRVKVPGSYEAGPFMTVTQAIAGAGGFEDDAARNSVVVFHRDGARNVKVIRVRVDEALKKGRLGADVPLSRFDIVFVPRSSIGNINVFSRQFFAENLTILQSAYLGWELFNLDRIFVITTGTR